MCNTKQHKYCAHWDTSRHIETLVRKLTTPQFPVQVLRRLDPCLNVYLRKLMAQIRVAQLPNFLATEISQARQMPSKQGRCSSSWVKLQSRCTSSQCQVQCQVQYTAASSSVPDNSEKSQKPYFIFVLRIPVFKCGCLKLSSKTVWQN